MSNLPPVTPPPTVPPQPISTIDAAMRADINAARGQTLDARQGGPVALERLPPVTMPPALDFIAIGAVGNGYTTIDKANELNPKAIKNGIDIHTSANDGKGGGSFSTLTFNDKSVLISRTDFESNNNGPTTTNRIDDAVVASAVKAAYERALQGGISKIELGQLTELQKMVVKDGQDGKFSAHDRQEIGDLAASIKGDRPVKDAGSRGK